jgi:hypothetical protein
MIFPDGFKKIGRFENNVYQGDFDTFEEFESEVNKAEEAFP